jgi:hypothetical protein
MEAALYSLDATIPRVLPPAWSPLASPVPGARAFDSMFGLHVIASVEDRGRDTGVWLHVSVSRRNKLPSWADLREVKDLFLGPKRCALHLIPPDEHYINVHPFVLHLWSRLDAPTVPPKLYEDQ